MDLYPFKFEPLGVRKVWGGRGLRLHLNKPFDWTERWGESWEVADNHDGSSIVANGPLAGKSLTWLNRQHGKDLVGAPQKKTFPGRFPLIAKFLDVTRPLSVQVHPDEATARTERGEAPKTEAWYIVHARSSARAYCGTRPGMTADKLKASFASNRPFSGLHGFAPKAGQTILLRGRTVHALADGLLVAEIQQNSTTTLRLHDFGRERSLDDDAPCELEHGLSVIDYERGPVRPIPPAPKTKPCTTLVGCEKFVIKMLNVARRLSLDTTQTGFHIVMVLDGIGRLTWRGVPISVAKGETVLVPACVGAYRLEGPLRALLAHLPLL